MEPVVFNNGLVLMLVTAVTEPTVFHNGLLVMFGTGVMELVVSIMGWLGGCGVDSTL